jgi:hypothetical protein
MRTCLWLRDGSGQFRAIQEESAVISEFLDHEINKGPHPQRLFRPMPIIDINGAALTDMLHEQGHKPAAANIVECLGILLFAPVITLVGYEVLGHRHQGEMLTPR